MAESENFRFVSCFDCSKEELYTWHSRSGALERLIPPWEKTSVIQRKGGLEPGGEVVMKMYAGILPFYWVAHHVENVPGEYFRDIMHKGPFSAWSHRHIFKEQKAGACLEDKIEYALPLHSLLPAFLKKHVDNTLLRTFHHRQKVLRADLELQKICGKKKKKVLISGASGVLGRALQPLLSTGGHEVWTLVRRKPVSDRNELFWDPVKGVIDDLPYFDAVIHLAGEYIGLGRWTAEKKKRVIESRTKGTSLLVKALASRQDKPEVFLSASAIGYYGDTKGNLVEEEAGHGSDFISEVCRLWEEAAEPAEKAGVRTVLMRIGISLSPGGGALQRLLTTSPVGFFRRLGSGDQYISWISIDDTISAIYHAMCCQQLEGPVNITAPHPTTNSDFMKILAEVTGKPRILPVPSQILKAVYGQMASEILLSGCKASCSKLKESGFVFRHEILEDALRDLLGKFESEMVGRERGQA